MNENIDACILCVGITVIDMISVVERYPEEDSDQRGLSFRKQRGGNASNVCTVLSYLNTPCEFLGVLPTPSDPEHKWLKDDFSSHNIQTQGCMSGSAHNPMSNIVISRQTGSRTIVFYDNGQAELSYPQFISAVGDRLSHFSWIHFELRPNVEDYVHMMETVREYCDTEACLNGEKQTAGSLSISVEIEQPSLVDAERAMLFADVIFISKDWAKSRGWTDMSTAVQSASLLCRPNCTVVCPWAEKGAALWHKGVILTAVAEPPSPVVDTLGAGDTFVAGFLHALALHRTFKESLEYACNLATAKCTMDGFKGLQTYSRENILSE